MVPDRMAGVLKMLERIPAPVVIASPVTAKILWVNPRLAKMARAGHPDQVVGMSLFDFVDPAQQGVALADLAKVALGQSPPPVIYYLKRLDGETAAVHVASVPIMFGTQPAMLSLVTDVSERERLMREIAESEERWRLLLASTPSGILVVVEDVIAYANDALAQALGLGSADRLVGTSMYDFIALEQRGAVREARRKVLLSGEPAGPLPVTLVRADGSLLETTAATTRVRWDGEVATQTLMHCL